ncbi:MAG: exonuclease SbcCD subunit D [Lachnospiraceae bacterium]|nr:exonuclease SbcCD subunit D [Lachnospiraceae bacterium]
MKLLHTSDWHLGAADGDRSLKEDQKFFTNEICRIVEEEKVDAVLIAGDVYDRSVSSADAIKLYDYAMTRLCRDLGAKVLIIAGNHDSAERLSSCSDLLSDAGLYIVRKKSEKVEKVSFEDTDVYLLPWITEERVKSVFPDQKENIQSLEDAYRVVLDSIRTTFDNNKKHIILSHAFITDSETSTSDRAAEIGFAAQVSAEVFDGFDYVALGHIHKPQDVSKTIRYSGTPMPYSFGKEENQEKSITVIDTADMSRTVVPLALLHKRTTFTGELDCLLHPTCEDDIREGYVRLQVTDNYVGLEALSELRRVYPNLLEASGKTFEGENATVTLSIEELEKLEEDPIEVFKYFCREEAGEEASDHLIELFAQAVKATEEAEL